MWDQLSASELAGVAGIGLLAGTLGGMLGVGGSVLMIPGLTWLFGPAQHLYQAAAMIANVAVSIPAALRHRRAGAIVFPLLKWMLPAALVCVLLGVAASNLPWFAGSDGGRWLGRVLAVFLIYVAVVNALRLRHDPPLRGHHPESDGATTEDSTEGDNTDLTHATPARTTVVGGVMGGIAGLLGIGGGALAVPLQQTLLHLPLRNAIANSSAVICVSAAVGAVYKNATLAQHAGPDQALTWTSGLALAALLAPTAWIGGRLGAKLTHTLPLRLVRGAFVLLMLGAAWRMAI